MSSDVSTSAFDCPSAKRAELPKALRNLGARFAALTHHGMALMGMALATLVLTLAARADLRNSTEQWLLGWLTQRQDSAQMEIADEQAFVDPQPAMAALNPLPKHQNAVTQWLSRRYRVAQEPLSTLVSEAFEVGAKMRLDPSLILAVMAIESRFNPYAQSPVGAQGLMQVLTRVHTDKYAQLGAQASAFDPLANLRVGVKVLQDCIKQAGSTQGGLRLYVGAVTTDGSDYVNKVMAEHLRIQSVALGRPMPTSFPTYSAPTLAAVPAEPAVSLPSQTDQIQDKQVLEATPATASEPDPSQS